MRHLILALAALDLAATGCSPEPDCVRLRLVRTDTTLAPTAVISCGTPASTNYPDGVRLEVHVEAIGPFDSIKGGA